MQLVCFKSMYWEVIFKKQILVFHYSLNFFWRKLPLDKISAESMVFKWKIFLGDKRNYSQLPQTQPI